MERVTDDEIATAFTGTYFGSSDHRKLLALSVLKTALKYHCGHTITGIMLSMGMTTKAGRVTEKWRLFCYEELQAEGGG
jgi:hypothetical protein